MLTNYCRCLVVFLTMYPMGLCMTIEDAKQFGTCDWSGKWWNKAEMVPLFAPTVKSTQETDGKDTLKYEELSNGVKITTRNSDFTTDMWTVNVPRGGSSPWLLVQFPNIYTIEFLEVVAIDKLSGDVYLTLSAGSSKETLTALYTGLVWKSENYFNALTTSVLKISLESDMSELDPQLANTKWEFNLHGCKSDACSDEDYCRLFSGKCKRCYEYDCTEDPSKLSLAMKLIQFCPVMCGTCSAQTPTALTTIIPSTLPPLSDGEIDLRDKTTDQSTTSWGGLSKLAVDGNTDGDFYNNRKCTHTEEGASDPWWQVDLGTSQCVGKVEIFNRVDCCQGRLNGAIVRLGDSKRRDLNQECGVISISDSNLKVQQRNITCGFTGRYLSVELPRTDVLTLCQVKAFECGADFKKREDDIMDLLGKLLA